MPVDHSQYLVVFLWTLRQVNKCVCVTCMHAVTFVMQTVPVNLVIVVYLSLCTTLCWMNFSSLTVDGILSYWCLASAGPPKVAGTIGRYLKDIRASYVLCMQNCCVHIDVIYIMLRIISAEFCKSEKKIFWLVILEVT